MHPEIENLINMALANDEVTEKERAILLRKAEALGEDKDEVEMILDGKIAMMKKEQASNYSVSKSNKEGDLKKCPSCGAGVKPFTEECADCGHVYRHDSLNKLTSEIKNSSYDLVSQISMHAIPINREALIEFLTFSYGNANNKALGFELRSAWNSKFNEALEKAKFSFQSLEDKKILKDYNYKQAMLNLHLMYTPEDKLKQERERKEMSKNPLLYIILFISYLMIAFLISLTGKHLWPF